MTASVQRLPVVSASRRLKAGARQPVSDLQEACGEIDSEETKVASVGL